MLILAIKNSHSKIIVFLSFVILIGVVLGSMMFILEHDHPNSHIKTMPTGIYWAIVTLTTVGYGDITPVTGLGRFLAALVMIIGYGVIAVPTGIFAAEALRQAKTDESTYSNSQICHHCHDSKHIDGAKYCKSCGFPLQGEK